MNVRSCIMGAALAALVGGGWAGAARADCGSIPFKPYVDIFEPNQRAVIAFNGTEQILLLSTDLRASEPTKVLEVIPFPNEPEVKKGRQAVFDTATELINRKLNRPRVMKKGMGGMGGGAFGGEAPPAGVVTQHKRIGAHEISVTKVLDRRRFVGWVEDYLRESGVDTPKIPRPLEKVIGEYLRDECQWFAFNVVELGTETKTKEAIQYRFKTRRMYYPLRITRAEKGNTTVRLIIVSPRLLHMPRLPGTPVNLLHDPVRLTARELEYLDEDIDALLKHRPNMLLRIWEVKGRLDGFRRDIVTGWYR